MTRFIGTCITPCPVDGKEKLAWPVFEEGVLDLVGRFLDRSCEGPPHDFVVHALASLVFTALATVAKALEGSKVFKADSFLKLVHFEKQ